MSNKEKCCAVYGCAHCPLNCDSCAKMSEDDIAYAIVEYRKQFPNAKHPEIRYSEPLHSKAAASQAKL